MKELKDFIIESQTDKTPDEILDQLYELLTDVKETKEGLTK